MDPSKIRTAVNMVSHASNAQTAHDHYHSPRSATYASLGVAAIGMATAMMTRRAPVGVQIFRNVAYTAVGMAPTLLEGRRRKP